MTNIEIAGLALGLIGTKGINSFDDETDEARTCKRFYDVARDSLLEDRIWTFATQRRKLNRLADAPIFGYAYQYLIPGDVVRVHRCDDGSGDGALDWVREGQNVLTDAEDVYATVVAKVTDASLYSPSFCIALAAKLAALIVVPLEDDEKKLATVLAIAEKQLKNAAGTDGSQGRAERVRPANSLTLRR